MNTIGKTNLFAGIPAALPTEWFQGLYDNGRTRIERIVSRGHRSPDGFWFDQAWDEWVLLLKGAAGLVFKGQAGVVTLGPGDGLLIPAGVKHRVAWTDGQAETVWLAVHIGQKQVDAPWCAVNGTKRMVNINTTGERSMDMDKRTYHEILDNAIAGEIEAYEFYRQVAGEVENTFLKGMFDAFAEEELMHRKILEGFRGKGDMQIHFTRVPDFHVSQTVEAPARLSMGMKPADAIALAMKNEEAAMRRYTQLAEACTDPAQRKIFLELAAMERGHKARMESAFVDIGYPEVW